MRCPVGDGTDNRSLVQDMHQQSIIGVEKRMDRRCERTRLFEQARQLINHVPSRVDEFERDAP